MNLNGKDPYERYVNRIVMRVLKPFGYHDNHEAGDIIHVNLPDVALLIKGDYAEIVINSAGYNTDFEVPIQDSPF